MKKHRIKSAFSLVEVTLALGMVSFVLVALLGLVGVSLKANRTSVNETLVPQLASMALARAKETSLPVPGTSVEFFYNDALEEKSEAADALYAVTITTREPDPASEITGVGTRLQIITIKVSYPSGESYVFSSTTKS